MSAGGASPRGWSRLLLAALVVGLGLFGWQQGWLAAVTADDMRRWAQAAGPWGPLLFVALFAAGEVLHVPSVIFVVVAGIVWPTPIALVTAYAGALVASAVVFVFARYLVSGGLRQLLERRMPPELRRYDEALVEHAVRTVALIRLVTFMAPLMHWVLATSKVRFWPMMAGTAIGLLPGVIGLVLLGDRAVAHWQLAKPYVYAAIALFVVVQVARAIHRRRRERGRVDRTTEGA
ncbi:MAG: VTT domain-containing protein [Polyangiaceae bacterium]